MEIEDILYHVLPQVRLFWRRTQPMTLILDLTSTERACASGAGGALATVAHQTRRVVQDKNGFVVSRAGQSRFGTQVRTASTEYNCHSTNLTVELLAPSVSSRPLEEWNEHQQEA